LEKVEKGGISSGHKGHEGRGKKGGNDKKIGVGPVRNACDEKKKQSKGKRNLGGPWRKKFSGKFVKKITRTFGNVGGEAEGDGVQSLHGEGIADHTRLT